MTNLLKKADIPKLSDETKGKNGASSKKLCHAIDDLRKVIAKCNDKEIKINSDKKE